MKSKQLSKQKNGSNKKRTGGNKRVITPKTLLGFGLFGLSSIGAALCANKKGIYGNNIDECKKYKTGKPDVTQYIGTKIENNYYEGTNKVFRTGCKWGEISINDDIVSHPDVCYLDTDFTFHDTIELFINNPSLFNGNIDDSVKNWLKNNQNDRELLNNQGTEGQHRYNYNCIDNGYDYKLTVGTLKKCKFYDEHAIKCKLSDKDKQTVIEVYKKYLEKKIEKIKNDNSVKTIALKYTNDRGDNGEYAFPVYPKDLKPVFLKMMDTGKNIYIKEFSCYHNEDFPELISELLKECPNYNGNFILQRNSKYKSILNVYPEVNFVLDKHNDAHMMSNMVMHNAEFIMFNKKEIKCISENKARKILGGSYLTNIEKNKKFNITYANKVFKECKKIVSEYEKYLNKSQEEKTYDDPLTKAILNEEAKNKAKKKDITKTGDL